MRLGPPKVLVQLQVPLETYTTLMEGKPDTQSRNAFFLALIEESRRRREPQGNVYDLPQTCQRPMDSDTERRS